MQAFERFFFVAHFAVASHFRRYSAAWGVGLIALASLALSAGLLIAPPADFPSGATIVIKQGSALPAIASQLAGERIIAHPSLFAFLMRITSADTRLAAGSYRFASPENVLEVGYRLATGESGIPDIRMTFAEGETVRQMATQVAKSFPEVSASDFIAAAGPYEGQLFPDTYRFAPSATAGDIVALLRADFDRRTASLVPPLASSTYPLGQILIMASIVQAEAYDPIDQELIAGVLWNRISKGIPLQVDATFGYLSDRDEYAPSLTDLSINSPYNTYKYKGLPPTPIGNAGLSALKAAAFPAETSYLYYLTGADGKMHYATTYAGHLANIKTYSTRK